MWFLQTFAFQQQASSVLTPANLLAWGLVLSVFFSGCFLFWNRLVKAWLRKDASLLPACFQSRKLAKPVLVPVVPVVLAGFWIAASIFQMFLAKEEKESIDLILLLVNQLGAQLILSLFLLLAWEFSREEYRLQDYFQFADWKAEMRAGLDLFLLAMPWTLVLIVLSQFWKDPEDSHILLQSLQQNGLDLNLLLLDALAVVVIGPIFEELLFRVLLLNGLCQRGGLPESVAVLIVSVVFCLAHGLKDTVQLLPLAVCLGWCLVRRQSPVAIVTGHALFNAFMLVLSLLQAAETAS